jgi:hypothetical protein
MSDFFFFTDMESFTGQDANDRYGPLSDTQYRVDTRFNVTAASKAYAVCDGLVLVQWDTNSGMNIILKPTVQPDFNAGKVAYFIYKGIDPTSLINGANIALRTKNDLTEKVWHNQEVTDLNAEITPSNTPSIDAIGLSYSATGVDDLLVPDTDTIDAVFMKQDDRQLPLINAGQHIGSFIGGGTKCGFEIILERVGEDPTMKAARTKDHIIEITDPLGTTDYQKFLHFHKKEAVLNYIDPAAFFGLFSNSQTKFTIKSTASTTYTIPQLIIKFQNKNRIYLDIRSEYDYSFNYYYTYGSQLGLSFDPADTPLTAPVFDFYTQNASSVTTYGSWPVFIIENQAVVEVTNDETHGKLFLKIPDENSVLKSIYFVEGRKNGKARENKFEDPSADTLTELSSWVYDDSGVDKFGASYLFLKLVFNRATDYEGLFYPGRSSLNHLFPISRLKMNLNMEENDVAIKSYTNGSVISRIEDPEYFGDLYGSYVGIAKDAHSYSFFAFPNYDIGFQRNDSIQPQFSFVTSLHRNAYDFMTLLYRLSGNISFEINEIESGEDLYKAVRILDNSEDVLNSKIDPALLDIVQFTHEEYEGLITLINSSNFVSGLDVYLAINSAETIIQQIANHQRQQLRLTLEGLEFVPGSNDTLLQTKRVDTDIYLNTLITKDF